MNNPNYALLLTMCPVSGVTYVTGLYPGHWTPASAGVTVRLLIVLSCIMNRLLKNKIRVHPRSFADKTTFATSALFAATILFVLCGDNQSFTGSVL
jgi:hypothetical protein